MGEDNTGDASVEEKNLRRGDRIYTHILPVLVRRRYRTVIAVVVVILLLETAEHFLLLRLGVQMHWLINAGLYALVLLTSTWLLLTMVQKTESEGKQANAFMEMQAELSRCLGEARTWDALVECIVAYPQQIAPQTHVTFIVYHPDRSQPVVEATCSREGEIKLRPPSAPGAEANLAGSAAKIFPQSQSTGQVGLVSEMPITGAISTLAGKTVFTTDTQAAIRGTTPYSYDLNIICNGQKLGELMLEYPSGSSTTLAELRALESAAPLIALALEGGLQQKMAVKRAAASEAERQQIAHNLHDTLAQNISYLRLKLDQLTGENAVHEISVVLQELERMRATADEAYMQVRHTLDDLAPLLVEDLATSITKQAQMICDRSALRLRTHQTGAPYRLPGKVSHQILFIAREALNNVEKHAFAEQVNIQFLWLEAELIVKITDDGVGFNPHAIPKDGHYGLWIMQQRAQEMGGTLKISPSDEKGTEVTLWFPRPANQPEPTEKV